MLFHWRIVGFAQIVEDIPHTLACGAVDVKYRRATRESEPSLRAGGVAVGLVYAGDDADDGTVTARGHAGRIQAIRFGGTKQQPDHVRLIGVQRERTPEVLCLSVFAGGEM